MSLWLAVRGVPVITGAVAAVLLGLALPISAAAAAPSPAGASVAAACILALIVPVAVAWGCGRGDERLEAVSVRPLRVLDLSLAAIAIGVPSLVAIGMHQVGLAPAGHIAARAMLVYGGLMLAGLPWFTWRGAAMIPALYLMSVVLLGRGEDVRHPAAWAWIAAEGIDPLSWAITFTVVAAGCVAYLVSRHRPALGG